MRFTIFGIIFIFSFWNKNFKRIGCAKTKLVSIDRVEITYDRSSHLQMFFKTGDLKILAIFKIKHLCWSLFLTKLLWSTLLQRDSSTGILSECYKIFKNDFCYRTPVSAFSLNGCVINELIMFLSCVMLQVRVSIIANWQLRISRYKRENDEQKCLLMIFSYFCSWKCVLHVLL